MKIKTMTDQYYQLKTQCRFEEKIKGSRFIATAKPVRSEEEALSFVEEIKKGTFKRGEKVLFIHTGGIYGLFPQAAEFSKEVF